MLYRLVPIALLCLLVPAVQAKEEIPPIARKLPPAGVKIDEADRAKIEAELTKVQARLKTLSGKASIAELLPDVQVYEKAVRYALLDDEFYEAKKAAPATKPAVGAKPQAGAKPAAGVGAAEEKPKSPAKPVSPRGVLICLDLLKTANVRLDELETGTHAWTTAKGTLVRGYTSDIDNSPQPYGLDIGKDVDLAKPVPLYIWLHGRGDTETDLYFIAGRQGKRGEVKHDDAIVLHPLGRHCVGYKSAGEIDVLDAIKSVQSRYKIDENRIVLCGFSMGGAGTWHIGAHYADRFCVVQPGAGFIDVQRYQKQDPATTPFAERTLWGAYDVPDYVRNLRNTNVVSYSGENDKQRASATIMAEEFKKDGRELTQFIGPKVEHKYLPLPEMLAKIAEYVKAGRNANPTEVHLQTRTLRYNKQFWVEVTGLQEHWKDARVDGKYDDTGKITIQTQNVSSISLHHPMANVIQLAKPVKVNDDSTLIAKSHIPSWKNAIVIDGTTIEITSAEWLMVPAMGKIVLSKSATKWEWVPVPVESARLQKSPGLQGPIDDAFMSPFLFVAPTGQAGSPAVQKWVDFEMKHQQDRWRGLMRGDVRIKKDSEITPDDIQKYNLVLWGDAKSNKLIAQAAEKLPAKWTADKLTFADQSYSAATTVPALIYPNPLNPQKYVVLNSSITFREAHDGTNSQQNPKLGDWAIIDITTPPSAAAPGNVVANGFFDEAWQVKPVGK